MLWNQWDRWHPGTEFPGGCSVSRKESPGRREVHKSGTADHEWHLWLPSTGALPGNDTEPSLCSALLLEHFSISCPLPACCCSASQTSASQLGNATLCCTLTVCHSTLSPLTCTSASGGGESVCGCFKPKQKQLSNLQVYKHLIDPYL